MYSKFLNEKLQKSKSATEVWPNSITPLKGIEYFEFHLIKKSNGIQNIFYSCGGVSTLVVVALDADALLVGLVRSSGQDKAGARAVVGRRRLRAEQWWLTVYLHETSHFVSSDR
jgi:hypothetical protein